MPGPIRILLVEDSARDAELVLAELKRAGLKFESRRVQSEGALREALLQWRAQVVVSDYSMPGFDGLAALAACREVAPEVPFIFMSGTIGEELAVKAMRAGANDYVMKSNLLRLGPAVKRELRAAESREKLGIGELALRRAQSMAMLTHLIADSSGAIETWSGNLPGLLGIDAGSVPGSGREWLQIVHPEDRALYRGAMLEAGRRGERRRVEYRVRRADGGWTHVLQVMEPLRGSDRPGGKMRWFNTLQDITAQKLVEAELQASEERYRATFEQAAVGVVHTTLEGDILLTNPAFCALIRHTRAEAVQLNIRNMTHAEDVARSVDLRARMLMSKGEPYERELRLIRKDRSEVWASVTTSLIRSADGRPHHFVSVVHDISERKRAEIDLRRFQAAMDISIDSIYLTDPESMRFLYVNDTACRRLDYTREELLAKTPYEVVGKTRAEVAREYEGVIAAGEKGTSTQSRFVRSDGSEGWTELHRRALTIDGGLLIVTLGRDITERKYAELALAESEARKSAILEASLDAIVSIDHLGRIVEFNPAAERCFGYTRAQAVGGSMAELIVPPELRARHREGFQRYLASREATILGRRIEIPALRADGSCFDAELTISLIAGSEPPAFTGTVRDITERAAAAKALRESEERFRSLTALSSDFYWETDSEHRVTRAEHGVEGLHPVVNPGQVGKARWETPSTYPDAAGWKAHRAAMDAHLPFRDFEVARIGKDGVERWRSLSGEPVFSVAGAFKGYRGVGKDITERKVQQKRLERLSRVHALLSGINAAIVRIRDRKELYREACRVALEEGGFSMAWVGVVDRAGGRIVPLAWLGADASYIRAIPLELDEAASGHVSLPGRAVNEGRAVVSEDMASDPRVVLLREEAAKRGYRSVAVLPLSEGGEVRGVLSLYASETGFFDEQEMKLLNELAGDISFALEVISKDEKLNYLALHDALTGLANRALCAERLGQSMQESGRRGAKFALAWLDLERLTTVNESLGRQSGDSLLRQLGERLSAAAGAANVARVAADNFVVLLPAVKGRSQTSRTVTELLRTCFAAPFPLEGNEVQIAGKAGLALFPNDGSDPETLLRNAEAAHRKAKESGERYVFFTPGLIERSGEALTLENKLRRALENDEFVLHYQPKVELDTRRIVGMEALIRWQSPELGLVPPMKFIPLMEETGLILDAGNWALQRASLDHRKWTEAGLKPPRVAVNVSPIQLRQRDFVRAVEQAILEGVAPTGIDLEITESLVMEDIEGNIGKLREVRVLGSAIAIDDFGTGYSSLAYLAKLPVQTLKIDRSFIITMLNEPDTMTLVQTIISLAHSLRLKVVAEGVDSEDQAKVLRLLRCDEMQGYLFSKPLPFAEMTALLKG